MEKKYISIDQLWKCETCFWMGSDGKCRTDCDTVESYRPAYSKFEFADVAPVVHARWEPYQTPIETRQSGWICTNCSGVQKDLSNGDTEYCPHCGAIMDGGEHGTE